DDTGRDVGDDQRMANAPREGDTEDGGDEHVREIAKEHRLAKHGASTMVRQPWGPDESALPEGRRTHRDREADENLCEVRKETVAVCALVPALQDHRPAAAEDLTATIRRTRRDRALR